MSKISEILDAAIELGLEQGLLEKVEISFGPQKFTTYLRSSTPGAITKVSLPSETKTRYGVVHPTVVKEILEPKPVITEIEHKEDGTDIVTHTLDTENEPVPDASKPFTPEQLAAQEALARMTGNAPVAEPKKRGRPKKQTAAFTLTQAEAPKEESAAPVTPSTTEAKVQTESSALFTASGESKTLDQWTAPEPPKPEPPKPVIEGLPSPEELTKFRKQLTHYADDILPSAGLVPSEGIGGVRMKIKLFVTKKYGADTKDFTADQWTDLLSFLEKTPAAEVVQTINSEIGAA